MEKKHSWFWPVQIGVWVVSGIGNLLLQSLIPGIQGLVLLLNFMGVTLGGFLLTTLYRYYLKKYKYSFKLSVKSFILRLTVSTLILSVFWTLFNGLIYLPFAEKLHIRPLALFINIVPLLLIMLAWNLTYLVYHLFAQYHITEIEKWQLQVEVQKAQMGNLKAQINPHFIFNALNNIRAMILEDHQQARHMLTKFSEILRYALQHSEEMETTVAQELYMLKQYLELVKIQYEERLVFSIKAAPALLTEKIPPMILQLLVENAVKHGIALNPAGGIIDVLIEEDTNCLLLTVSNTGNLVVSNQLEESLGVGLKNITERLKLIYGNKAILTMEEKAPNVIVVIKLDK